MSLVGHWSQVENDTPYKVIVWWESQADLIPGRDPRPQAYSKHPLNPGEKSYLKKLPIQFTHHVCAKTPLGEVDQLGEYLSEMSLEDKDEPPRIPHGDRITEWARCKKLVSRGELPNLTATAQDHICRVSEIKKQGVGKSHEWTNFEHIDHIMKQQAAKAHEETDDQYRVKDGPFAEDGRPKTWEPPSTTTTTRPPINWSAVPDFHWGQHGPVWDDLGPKLGQSTTNSTTKIPTTAILLALESRSDHVDYCIPSLSALVSFVLALISFKKLCKLQKPALELPEPLIRNPS